MSLGARVVRGPDWTYDTVDGGQDHVGTVVDVKGDNSVVVQWDMGQRNACRCGEAGKHDVLIFDNAPIGVTHEGVPCVYCGDACIVGTRWTCAECSNVDLCTPCYFDDEHDVKHAFVRKDLPGCDGVPVKRRASSQRSRSLGIYPTAKVVRGPDWESGNKDGGKGKSGVVEDIVSYGKDSSTRNAVRVRWSNSATGVYRVGYKGRVDLQCIAEAPGADYYREHLASIDIKAYERWQGGGSPTGRAFNVGDKVCVVLSKEELRAIQKGKFTWNKRMEEIVGEIGELKSFTIEGDFEVDFSGDVIKLVSGAAKLVPTYKVGDHVKLTEDRVMVKRLQKRHGGWDDQIIEVLGKVGKVTAVDSDGDVGVTFDAHAFVFHPCCLIPAPGERVTSPDPGSDRNSSMSPVPGEEATERNDEDESINGMDFLQFMAGLALFNTMAEQQEPGGSTAFANACVMGNALLVKDLLKKQPSLVNTRYKLMPVLSIAGHKGHLNVVKALLDAGADINILDQKKNTPLLVALMTGNAEIADVLIKRGADLTLVNCQKRSTVHVAAHKDMVPILKLLLSKGCDPNQQDAIGDTPLHDAISERQDAAASVLIAHPKLDVWLQNEKLFTTLSFACLKGHGTKAQGTGFMKHLERFALSVFT